MVTLNNEAIKEIRKIIEKEGNPFNAGEYIYEYINSIFPCDNLTFSIRATKESLKAILSKYPDTFVCGQIHYSMLEEVFEELGWIIDNNSFEHNGWQHDTWFDVLIPDKDIGYHISCSWAYPEVEMKKFNLDKNGNVSRTIN